METPSAKIKGFLFLNRQHVEVDVIGVNPG